MKKILITGKNSYIGTSLENWLMKEPDKYKIDSIDMKDGSWKDADFSQYDVVFHVAGIAHIKETKENKDFYYKVNRDLAYETARKAKGEAVRQFIFLSSMSVYGIENGVIDKNTPLNPNTAYGKSKLEAEELIKKLEDESFIIAIIRPPMVYGKGCRGNYPRLAGLALKTPIFPKVDNKRSMIYIDNLSEFVKQLIDCQSGGLFFPQNNEYVTTSKMVELIAQIHGKRICLTKLFNPLINLMKSNSTINKIFGDLVYKEGLFNSNLINNFIDFEESIKLTEDKMKKAVILSNHHIYTYNFRREIIQALLNKNYEVYLVLPYGEKVERLIEMGCKFIDLPLNRRGINPINDLRLLFGYYRIIKSIKPNVVLTYTIKPNVYGGIACKATNTPYLANVTGLGTSVENEGVLQKITLTLYKHGLKKAACVFFQNETNRQFFIDKHIVTGKTRLIPGSGVNLNYHCFEEYPDSDNIIKFLFIGRIMKDKGIDELLEAAQKVKCMYPNVQFDLVGYCEENYTKRLSDFENRGIIKYHGQQDDVHSFIKGAHAIIHPSYHEGMANVLLEAASTGRPVLASNIPGCRETFDEGVSGYGFEVKNTAALVNTIEKFIRLPYKNKKQMGIAGRAKVEREFDRQIVIDSYMGKRQTVHT